MSRPTLRQYSVNRVPRLTEPPQDEAGRASFSEIASEGDGAFAASRPAGAMSSSSRDRAAGRALHPREETIMTPFHQTILTKRAPAIAALVFAGASVPAIALSAPG
jgi:hypothetical protein